LPLLEKCTLSPSFELLQFQRKFALTSHRARQRPTCQVSHFIPPPPLGRAQNTVQQNRNLAVPVFVVSEEGA
jgi:hypothetical protein